MLYVRTIIIRDGNTSDHVDGTNFYPGIRQKSTKAALSVSKVGTSLGMYVPVYIGTELGRYLRNEKHVISLLGPFWRVDHPETTQSRDAK
jgi:hypothetical protein